MKTMSAVFFALLLGSFALAQQRWTRTYGGTNDDFGYSVQQTLDGGYIIAGYTKSFGAGNDDVYLIKTNASGDTLWTRTYGGTSNDFGYSVEQTLDRGYIIAGYTNSFGAGAFDIYLIKTNASGDTIWTRTYGGTGNDYGYSVQQTSDSGYIVAGYTNSFGAGSYDVYLIKTNALGDAVWTRTYGGTNGDYGNSVRQTADEGYVVAGYTLSFGAGGNVYLVKTNASGDTLWTRSYGGSGWDEGQSVRQASDSGYVVAGYTNSFGAGEFDAYLVKASASGDTIWARTWGGTRDDVSNSVRQTADEGYVIAGYTYSFRDTLDGDVWLVRLDTSGETLWTRTYGGTSNDYGYSVQQTSDRGCIVAGCTESFGAGLYDVYLIKTDASGSVGMEEPRNGWQQAAGSIEATPNPFVSFARIPGHEAERFDLYDISGKMVGTNPGDRVGEGLSPAVYFIKPAAEHGRTLRIVKVR